MEKKVDPSLFVNDGSFMEKFKQLQQEQLDQLAKEPKNSASSITVPYPPKSGLVMGKRPLDVKATESKKPSNSSSNVKLAFSLKQKSKVVVAPVKLGGDEEEEVEDLGLTSSEQSGKKQKLDESWATESSTEQKDVAPSIPSDPAVKKVADKLASFVAKNGRQFEHITRQRNPGDTAFKFLFDTSCMEYKYYEKQLLEEERILAQAKDSNSSRAANAGSSTPRTSNSHRSPGQQHSNYQTPASALYECNNDPVSSHASAGKSSIYDGESSGGPPSNAIAMMEFYMNKAAQEERKRQPRQSKDEMPPPASLQGPIKKGHHMGDYIPQEELEKFMASCNDVAAQKAAREAAEKAKIQADNVGHKLLSKMGWKEGEGLGSDKHGRADPVVAGNVKLNNLGIGAQHPGEVTAEDDIYEQYKKRMMLGYRYRPNPLNNPRKAYY
ncbi:putative SURP and G-patch domain-containing protein [Dioscorea sansibarensis]